ncbi:hypothetical protein A6S61_22750 [Salmonella enterica]|nr:hypothetical protein [Salmonella enterica]
MRDLILQLSKSSIYSTKPSIPSESPLSSGASKISKEKSISSVVPVLEKVSDENQTASISIKSKAKANKRLATLAR